VARPSVDTLQEFRVITNANAAAFVLYSLRHTCLTRRAEAGMDMFVLKKLAGHASISTTMRYTHMSDAHVKAEMERVMKVQTPHSSSTE